MLGVQRVLSGLASLGKSPRVQLALALLALALVGWSALAPRPSGALTIDRVTVNDDGTELQVEADVTNGTSRPLYVYDQRALGYDFDEASGTLTLVLHTVPRPPTGSSADCHVILPSFREIAPGRSSDLRLKAPRRPKTYVPGGPPRENPVPSHVRIELGWSDEPIALHRGEEGLCTYDAGVRLLSRERGILTATSR